LVIDIQQHEDGGYDDWDDGSGRLAALAPLRTDLLSGDLRLFYLLWLTAFWIDLDALQTSPTTLARMQGADRTFYVGGATDFELVEPIVVHSKSIVEKHFAGVVHRANS